MNKLARILAEEGLIKKGSRTAGKEDDIVFEEGDYWVGKTRKPDSYTVYFAQPGLHHSVPDSSYPLTDSGLSLATARARYLARRSR